jgi:flagellar motor protein MotB
MLKQKGLSGKDLLVLGFGSHQPLRPNNSAENKRLNRRVEIFVADAGE